MKSIDKLRDRLSGLYDAISRYPLTMIFLLGAAIVNAMGINRGEPYYKFFMTFVVGACIGFTMQAVWERYFEKLSYRIALMGICVLLTLGYFLIIRRYTRTSEEIWIRTSVAIFALIIAYIWVPAIKNTVSFNESFMSTFKSFFNSLLFSVVIIIGISIIISAIQLLLFRVTEKAYMHSINIVLVLFVPIYFLSLIPIYPGVSDKNLSPEDLEYNKEKIKRSSNCPRFLEILISYIIIPLLSLYTVILVIYISTNVNGKFWTDNRLEPMLVGFAITVILLYILASSIKNKFAELFRKIFPKLLVPIVVFQIVSSVLRTQNMGITHGRYYVIWFGIFAAVSGVILSFIPVRKNGIIAMLLIVFALVSIVPPVDAFTISRANQQEMLKSVLIKNNMIQDNKITPNASISDEDKKVISNTINYLAMMEYTKDIEYLGKDFERYDDFYDTFGFYRYEENIYGQESVNLSLNQQSPISISGYDTFVMVNFYFEKDNPQIGNKVCDFEKAGKIYTISKTNAPDLSKLWLSDDNGKELISVNMKDVFHKFDTSVGGNNQTAKDFMTADKATFTQENDRAVISLVALNLNIQKSNPEQPYNGDFYVLIKIK